MVKMKMPLQYILLCLLSCSLFMTSCKKDEMDEIRTEVIEEGSVMQVSLSGIILDEDRLPVEGVSVRIDNYVTYSDENGIYAFKDIDVFGPRANISFIHDQYFKLYKSPQIKENTFVQLDATLAPLSTPSTITSSSGGEVISDEGIKIDFPANAFVTADGTTYNGPVRVYTNFLDPTSAEIAGIFPSDFEILDDENKRKIMQLYSGIAVELYGSNNEVLEIDKPASVSFPLPSNFSGNAPSTIDLGHFDEELGIWKREGQATLQGNAYVADLNHFSYWCCVVMQDPTNILGFVLEDLDATLIGLPVNDLLVKVSLSNSGIAGFTRTLSTGFFSMKVPKGLELVLEIYANSFDTECGDPVYTQNLGPLSEFENLGNIFITTPDMITITGTVQDCNEQNFTSGYVLFSNQEGSILMAYILSDGSFFKPLYTCDDQVSIVAYNEDFTYKSESLTIPNTESDVILNGMVACEAVTVPPYLLKVITGGDTLIGSANNGFINNAFDGEGNITTLSFINFEIDILNTSQALNAGAAGVIINMTGIEDAACVHDPLFSEFAIPLKDDVQNTYIVWISQDLPDTWIQTYNCIEGAEYLHFQGQGELQFSSGAPHRDPVVDIEVYFPL